jgi:UDP-2-acetamido-3-amino-2,3-dideoxy-glucuronate N-acetyltransferase
VVIMEEVVWVTLRQEVPMGERIAQIARPLIHETAQVSPHATIGAGTRIWHFAQVREEARIGQNCIVGKGAYIDLDVEIGSNCKIQNSCMVYHGATLMDGVFLGPGVILTNDRRPRAVNTDGSLKSAADWAVEGILIQEGASLGAGTVVLPGVIIGRWAMVGAGSVVTHNVPDHGLVWGNPARLQGFVCPCGSRLQEAQALVAGSSTVRMMCPDCGRYVEIPVRAYDQLKEKA